MTFGKEIGCPSWPSIWSIQEIGAGLSCACNEDDGKWWICRGWIRRKLLDVNLPYENQ